jgi:hypothetical protein
MNLLVDKLPAIVIEQLFVYVFGINKIHFGTMLEVGQEQPKKQHAS